jgi:hypothetical protein
MRWTAGLNYLNPEQVEAARTALEERLRKLRKAKKTEAARQNPIVR